jgi:uncharacterized protein (TIGR02646 family)
MFKISKNEPDFFIKSKSKVKFPKNSNAWSSTEIEAIRPQLREHILLEEQNLLCAYCEKTVDDNPKNSNIDHFKLKAGHLFPEKTLDYTNLVVSCNTNGRCSSYKDTHIKLKEDYNNIVNPIIENPDDFFDYLITGRIIAIDNNPKAEFTINIFQLGRDRNEPLSRQRKEIADSLEHIKNLSLDEVYDIFGNEFYSFIKAIYPKINKIGEEQ